MVASINNTVPSNYELCFDGPYHPFRDHDTQFGWGIRHMATGSVFGYIGDRGSCFGVAAALNGHWEAAKSFMEHSPTIEDGYFTRFKKG